MRRRFLANESGGPGRFSVSKLVLVAQVPYYADNSPSTRFPEACIAHAISITPARYPLPLEDLLAYSPQPYTPYTCEALN